MEDRILYKVERIRITPQGRIFCIKSNKGTTFEMLVSEEQYLRFEIEEGDEIDDNRFLSIREEMLFDNARRTAFNILACGENNKKSLINKLQAKGYSYELCKNISIYMENRGYINERKQIGLLCETFLRKKYGKLKIINELVVKGYQREDVMEYVSKALKDVNFVENCAYIIENKYDPMPTFGDELKKMMGALMRYGYTIMDIKRAIDVVKENQEDEA